MKTLRFFLLFCLILSSKIIYSQIDQSKRLEYDLDKCEGHSIFTFKNQKCALVSYFKEIPQSKKSAALILESLNENLKVQKTISMDLDGSFYNVTHSKDENFYYYFNYDSKKGQYIFIKVNPTNLEIQKTEGTFGTKVYIEEWIVIENTVYLAAVVKKVPVFYIIDINASKLKTVFPQGMTPIKLQHGDLEKIKTPTGYEAKYQLNAYINKNQTDIYLLQFDDKGNQLGNFLIMQKPDEETQLLSATLTKVSGGKYIATGSYSKNKREHSNGIYIASFLSSGKFEFIKYYNFLDITNFTGYLSEKSQEKIEKKQAKKESQGEELNLNYQVTVHDLIEKDGKYLFLGEFYYPTYRTQTYTTYINGKPSTTTTQVFDGYQYSHAAIAAFDETGKMLWSNAFEMWLNSKPYFVKQFICTSDEGKSLGLVYITGSFIKAISYSANGKSLKDQSIEMVSTDLNEDKIKYTLGGDMDFWYGNNFLCSGNQKIKNSELDGNKKRSVFFINKISY